MRGPGAKRFLAQPSGVRAQLVVARRARRRDRRLDPAGRVAFAPHPGVELGGPVAREHQMRVAVDEAGQRRAARSIHARSLDAVGHIGLRTDPRDPVTVDRHRGVVDDAEWAAVVRRIVRDELADVLDEHYASAIGMRTPRSSATAFARS